ncbi:hypothetical protein SK128_004881 [Halocaridina rubra]|uniref:Uncharacterized protein n=1 Tax=Halocaridina rubra TaxID=373956 RepID=A0AAN9ABV8_HALRR
MPDRKFYVSLMIYKGGLSLARGLVVTLVFTLVTMGSSALVLVQDKLNKFNVKYWAFWHLNCFYLESLQKHNDKGRKSPVNLWGSCLKPRSQGLCIQGQGTGQSQIHWEEDDHFGMMSDGPTSFIASSRHQGADISRNLDIARNLDLSRHPYTISLDRTKELFGRDNSYRDNSTHRDFTRDPLREIKDNPRGDPLGHKELRDSMRRPKMEIMGWTKPRLLNDDLSLPNVPGGKKALGSRFSFWDTSENSVTAASNNGNTSPKKNGNSSGAANWVVGNKTQKPSVIMPVLNNIQRSSATSVSVFTSD